LHSVLADRAFSSGLPRRRVLAIGPDKGRRLGHLKPSAIALFQNDYQLPLIDPTVAAYVSAFNEHLFPILLVLGLATRFAALALLLMTAVIEIFVYPGAWPTHGVWATCFLLLLARGPGALSLDHLIARRYKTPPVA
jgi:putative oxidoreductase